MELDSFVCVSSSDRMDEDEAAGGHLHHAFTKSSHVVGGNAGANGGFGAGVAPPGISLASISVHELLECPVCTNSMYPPIHQAFGRTFKG